jgi:hypothetical protein
MRVPASLRCLVAALLASVLAAPSVAAQRSDSTPSRRAFTIADARLYEQPQSNARTVVILPRATLVSVGNCDESWCGVAFRGITGFTARRYLAFSKPVAGDDSVVAQQAAPVQSGRGYINSRGQWVPSPQRTADGRPPAGASAQCRDDTYSFSQSRRGTCFHHGGVARWLR